MTVPLRRLSAELRRLRLAAGLTFEQVAERTGISIQSLSRAENSRVRPRLQSLITLCGLYGVSDAEQAELLALFRAADQREWFIPNLADLPERYATYIGLESEAAQMSTYETISVPGLLQTEDYARAMNRGNSPETTEAVIQERVDTRMARQQVFRREGPPRLWAIMDEAAIRREVGGTEVMRAQRSRLVEDAHLPNVTVQVIPFANGAHAGMDGSFVVLDFAGTDPSTVYMENGGGDLFLNGEANVTRYRAMFDHLRAAALTPDQSIDLISSI